MDSLPHIDEHSTEVAADRAATWEALLRVVEGFLSSSATPGVARLLGSVDREASGPRPLAAGSTLPGFHVEAAEPPGELALAGRHRFSAYALIFRLDELGSGRTRLRAETRAEFPGFKGAVYRALVIGSRGHVLATRRILTAVKRRAERAPAQHHAERAMPSTFKLTPSESLEIRSSTAEALEVEATYGPGGKPPPAHFHPSQDEHFEVLAGRLSVKVEGEQRELGVGETIEIARGRAHQMWNPNAEPARVRWTTSPALRTERWFRDIDALHREGRVGRNGMPGPLAFGTLLTAYRDVFRLAGPDWLLRPLLAAIGTIGRARGYRASG